MKEGSVVAAAFPQADGGYKLRPAVILKFTEPHGDAVLSAVSSQLHLRVEGLDELISEASEDFAGSGLRQASIIRSSMLLTLPRHQIPRELGSVSAERFGRLRANLSKWLSPTTISSKPSAAVPVASPFTGDLKPYLAERVQYVDRALDSFMPSAETRPATIHKAMRHSVFAGGKRLRPILCLAASEACGGTPEIALFNACAVECLHTYSLIHDDLPCMDDDDMRRGVPTCHKVYGEAMALLAGDALQALAFELVAKSRLTHRYSVGDMVLELARTAGSLHLVGGQVADLEGEKQKLNLDDLRFVHESKTAALLTTSVKLGGMTSDAMPDELQALEDFGMATGLAFQIIDDILDVTQTSEKLGKSAGKDLASEKSTYPALMGLDASREEARKLTERAMRALDVFGVKGERLRQLANHLLERDY